MAYKQDLSYNTPKLSTEDVLVTISKDDFTPELSSFGGRVSHFMKMANVSNFFVSDSEVLKHH
jgi:hypothetical protein